MKYKAVYKGRVKDRYGDAVYLTYEYRGHEYMICDPHNGYSESLKTQHENEQRRIDQMLDTADNATEDAMVALDAFWNYLETGDWS